ncbi:MULTISPECIES: energy-coupling factor transporter transmembrane component T family protein [Cohaesibacter]|uniref:energy-coupling factor transporter transmembrane component T family protein n=1 Tax=Cohaesibacter TaxID=655352 RepID=UPI000DEBAFA9|nr:MULTISPECIES: energy-coupling factor transporter transmembrane component T [Cohaesibacter]TLP44981.1 energy-coupling factor transporter transmembrane protein EcfT [Cohaesibacter sp. CAU 1516]
MLALTVETKTWLHRIPVPLKLAILCALTLVIMPLTQWQPAVAATMAVASLYLSAGLKFARIGLTRLKPIVYLLVVIFVYHVVTSRTEAGLAISLKLFATVGLANLVTMTSRLDDMMQVVETLTAPLKFVGLPPRAFGFAMGLVIRFTPVFLEKGKLLSEAWRARSAKGVSPRLLVPLALGALDDADRVAEAIKARGGLVQAPQDSKNKV